MKSTQDKASAAPALSYIALTSSCVCLLHRWDELHEQGPRLRPHLQRGSRKRRSVVRVPSGFRTGQKPERLHTYVSHLTAVPLTMPTLTHTHTHTHEEPGGLLSGQPPVSHSHVRFILISSQTTVVLKSCVSSNTLWLHAFLHLLIFKSVELSLYFTIHMAARY